MTLNERWHNDESSKYRSINHSYDDINKHTTTNNIVIKYYQRKKRNKMNKIISRININNC